MPTWTYRPQNRQDGAAFAFPSLLRCRSCRLMGACVMAPLPPLPQRHATQEGPLAPRAFPRFCAPTDPSVSLASSVDFPVDRFYTLPCFRRCRGGTQRASPLHTERLTRCPQGLALDLAHSPCCQRGALRGMAAILQEAVLTCQAAPGGCTPEGDVASKRTFELPIRPASPRHRDWRAAAWRCQVPTGRLLT